MRDALAAIALVSIVATTTVAAAPPAELPPSVTIHGTMVGGNPFQPGSSEAPYKVTIFSRGDKGRVDIQGSDGQRAMFLNDDSSREGWIISLDEGVALPTPAPGIGPLQLDPKQPCLAIDARCERVGQRFIAGQVAEGWRYRGAAGRGPAGTSDGVFWVDPDGGAVVGFESARTRRGAVNSMQAESVSYHPLPDAIFDVPQGVDLRDPPDSP